WLADLHFEEYLHLFVDAGYDMPTISRMTPEDLTAVGITKPAHRKRLKAELSKLHIHDGIPDFKPVDVAEWLQLLNLMEYTTTLLSEGYSDIDTVTDITWEDLEEIGIKRLVNVNLTQICMMTFVDSRNSSSDDAEVFNDIDNMLQDLTMELDAMLDDVS
ncbi:hypothetical protein CAPTEDRAFT_102982, partial [Capitella teleta]